jgi:hypothetical protein
MPDLKCRPFKLKLLLVSCTTSQLFHLFEQTKVAMMATHANIALLMQINRFGLVLQHSIV